MRSDSIYERYRERMNRLVHEKWSIKIIDVAVQRWSDWDNAVVWKRSYGRFNPGGSPYAAILFEQPNCSKNICFVEIFDAQPPMNQNTLQYFDQSLGWLQLRRFPDDPCLTNLPRVLKNAEKLEVLRYRPYKRCTFRLSKLDCSMPIFGKLFADKRGKLIHQESSALWDAAMNGQLQFAVAKPIAWDKPTNTLWQHSVPGSSVVDQLFGRNGIQIAERIGSAAASITQSSLNPSLHFGGAGQMQRSNKYASELLKLLPDQKTALEALLHSLAKNHQKASGRARKPLHGAPHAHQWLMSKHGLGLVDFDRFCIGDPELDAATFIGEMDFEDLETVPIVELNGSFLDAYQHIAGPLDSSLLQTYRCHKRLAKALKAVRSIRTDGDHKARRHIDFARQVLC